MMSVDIDKSTTYLVADTSVLIQSLPVVLAIAESNQPYTLYIPYIALTELDKGKSAAPVNRLLCRYMKQKNPRIIAQGVTGHKDVSLARGVAAKNDDLILGAALKLRDDGVKTLMLTNDNNLSVKCCANGLTAWSSLDLMCNVRDAFSVMERFLTKDFSEVCSRPYHLFSFCTELFMCALKFFLEKQDQLSSINNKLVFTLVDEAIEKKLLDKSMLNRCSTLIKEYRKKSRGMSNEDVQRFLRYVCALLEQVKKDKSISKILNICKCIFAAIKNPSKKTSKELFENNITSSIASDSKTKKKLESMTAAQKQNVMKLIANVDKSRKKNDGIKKNTRKRKNLPKTEDSDCEKSFNLSTNRCDCTVSGTSSALSSATDSKPFGEVQEMCDEPARVTPVETSSEMEVDSVSSGTQQQIFGPLIGDNITQHPVYRMLEAVWTQLHNMSGTWASKCGVDYVWKQSSQIGLELELTSLQEAAAIIQEIDADYSRLLKLGNSVAPELLLEISKRFIDSLRKVCAVDAVSASTSDVVQFFQDDRTRELLLSGQAQLHKFCDVIIQCRKIGTESVLHRLSDGKR